MVTKSTKKTVKTEAKKTVKKPSAREARKAKAAKYDEDNLKHLEGLKGIRKRPTMYISEIGEPGVKRLLNEAVGNVLDEYEAGRGNTMWVSVNEITSQITVSDNSVGIPVGKLEDVLTKIHMGGKFDDDGDAYGFSIGMNGVGLKAVNALSARFDVVVKRDGYKHLISFEKGELVTPTKKLEKTKETGTTLTFIPDIEVMRDITVDAMKYLEFLEQLSYMNKGLKIIFHAIKKDKTEINKTILSKNGLVDYLNVIEKTPLLSKPIVIEGKSKKMEIELVMNYSQKKDYEDIKSFVNGIETVEHGTHVGGFRAALTNVFTSYIKDNNILPKKDAKLEITGDDVREGLSLILSFKHYDPLFSSQTKDKLTNNDATGYARKVVADQMNEWLVKNKSDAKILCQKIILSAKGRMAAKRAKTNTKNKDNPLASISNLSKYVKCLNRDPKKNELFIVEGNSAGGSAAQGKDNQNQSIYKLRGKPLNTHDADMLKILKNKECSDLSTIIGTGIGNNFTYEDLLYAMIIVMADADVDGSHITSLTLTYIYKHMRPLIEKGHVYVALPPLFKIMEGRKAVYIQNTDEYILYIQKRILKEFTIAKVIEGKAKALKPAEVKSLLNKTRKYLNKLDNIASATAIHKSIIEFLAINSELELKKLGIALKRKFKELNVKLTKGGLFVDGIVDENFQSFIVNDNLIHDIRYITNLYKELDASTFALKQGDGKAKVVSLGEMLETVYEYATPKHRQRYKGLGEMNPTQLWETTMDPEKRTLIQVQVEDFEKADNVFTVLMGKNADLRKEFMANYEIDSEDIDS